MKSLFDIQINGFSGVDFQQMDLSSAQIRHAVDALARFQTRRFFATLITDDLECLEAKLKNFEQKRGADPVIADAICGYHLEGPWLSAEPGYCGAHDPGLMRAPMSVDFDRLQQAAGGNIRLVTLAPELPGSAEFIREVTGQGVQVSIGHCHASGKDIEAAVAAGARFCTHLGNGVPIQLPRHDNIIQRLLARDELTAFLIPDGHHVPPFALRNIFRAKPHGKALFTTDCMAAAGAPGGRYWLGKIELTVGDDRVVRLPGSMQFAGSSLTPLEAISNSQKWLGLDQSTAWELMSDAVASAFSINLPEL